MMALTTTEPDELLRGIKSIAAALKVGRKTVWKWKSQGKLPIKGTGKNQYALKNELLTAIERL
jgi:hypothetical protein